MARSQEQIKLSITNQFIGNVTIILLYGLTAGLTFIQQFSLVSLENILFDTIAFAVNTLESLWDIFRTEITAEMAQQQAHTKDWYRNKALGFMLGVPVLAGTDQFDTSGLSDDAIAAAQVIKQAAAIKLISDAGYGILRIKVATSTGLGLAPVPAEVFSAFKSYMLNKVVDAGTQVVLTTREADKLRLTVDAYFDPLVLSPEGARLDGTATTPVPDALNAFVRSFDFNGKLNIKEVERAISAVPGIFYANITAAASKYGGYSYEQTGIDNVGAITMFRVADSGYFEVDDLVINYIVMEA